MRIGAGPGWELCRWGEVANSGQTVQVEPTEFPDRLRGGYGRTSGVWELAELHQEGGVFRSSQGSEGTLFLSGNANEQTTHTQHGGLTGQPGSCAPSPWTWRLRRAPVPTPERRKKKEGLPEWGRNLTLQQLRSCGFEFASRYSNSSFHLTGESFRRKGSQVTGVESSLFAYLEPRKIAPMERLPGPLLAWWER